VSATNIDGVIDQLQGIIDGALAAGSRLGYFAALYKRMTMAVRDGITSGLFEDNARMETLDVAFANRYLATHDQYLAGELQGQCWLQAYEAAGSDRYTVLQHLLIGINPHIMIDLGVAAARTCPGTALAGLEKDFGTINTVILKLMPVVDQEIDQLSPTTAAIDHVIGPLKDQFINRGIDCGRNTAWAFAQSLAFLDLGHQAIAIGHRDREARLIGDAILADPIAHLIRHRESTDVCANIRVLNG
jgi:hypothetical protein